ncbi:putative RNA recognition motif (a k a RRM RBD or RNP domain) [Trypanosoma vivax]|nr:putative RNA-binding protein [Trypanosoma vivax]KAH8608302.1 putative RNA recognition motif (a k a RRM RBD or RNP domain) [Trypanosoma vivax]
MSRVRILNLPRDCTEESLRRHLLNSLPPNSPHIEITDCAIIRQMPSAQGKGGTHDKRHHHAGSSPSYSSSSVGAAGNRGIIRMAFVGFRNATCGHFVVKHFDGTYFGASKMRVGLAKGLADVGVTVNMKKKEQRQLRVAGLGVSEPSNTSTAAALHKGKDSNTSVKRQRGLVSAAVPEQKVEVPGDAESEGEEQLRKRKRKEEFIADRTRATSGPTWAAEVLVPESSGQPSDGGVGAGENACGEQIPDECVDEELSDEADRRALERQQTLGTVSDMEFLSSLAKKPADACNSEGGTGDANSPINNITDETRTEEVMRHGEKGKSECDAKVMTTADNDDEAIVRESRRVRLGNIPFIATEDDVKQFASSHVGPVEAVHIPLTRDTRQSKGAAFVKFVRVDDALRALTLCRGAIFMGRLLRVAAAVDDPYGKKVEENGVTLAGSSDFKRQKALNRRKEAEEVGKSGTAPPSWSGTYMSSHTAVEVVAKRLGVTSGTVVSVEARGAAVRAAIAEAYLTSEVRQVLGDEGIDFSLLDGTQGNLLKARSNTTILVKNITLTQPEDATQLSKLFLRYGTLESTAFPSSGAFALFRFAHSQDARIAFQRLSYKLFKNVPLFLEWAPIGVISTNEDDVGKRDEAPASAREQEEEESEAAPGVFAPVMTLFITNIPFTSTEDEFYTFLLDTCPRLAKRPEKSIERLAYEQTKGRAFLTLRDEGAMSYVQQRLNGRNFAGRTLACVVSKQTANTLTPKASGSSAHNGGDGMVATSTGNEKEDATKASVLAARCAAGGDKNSFLVPPGCDPLKLVVKNVPFEATERDIRDLFSAVSEVHGVRLPRKNHQFSSHRQNNHRGFAFVEFLTEQEARRARESLGATHLYGRHLVIQYAKLDE